jgi:hypothetical protein
MKVFIAIAVVIGVLFGAYQLWEYWDKVNHEKQKSQQETGQLQDSRTFEGMPLQLEQSLEQARQKGPETFKQWLDKNRPLIKDPRLAAVELDYVVAITRSSPVEAKKIFADVKARIPETSPLYKRIRAMEKTYQ